jgi:hypothetical protein
MATEPLAMAPFTAGLTNQKLALIGLASRARAERRAIVLAPLVDYRPDAKIQAAVTLDTVLDRQALATGLALFGVALTEGSCEPVDGDALLDAGGAAIADARRGSESRTFDALCVLLAAMRPAAPIAAEAERISAWLTERGVGWGCQVRIERDWLHWTALHRADARVDAGEALYVTYDAILAKLAAEAGPGPVYATCNEADLPLPRAEIADHARHAHGLELIFRSQIPAGWIPPGPLAGAALDFAVAGSLPRFAGHTRSTFFGALALTAHGAGQAREYWLYNNRGSRLKRRTDHGAFVRPWAAAHL